jgi:hypothetical protein
MKVKATHERLIELRVRVTVETLEDLQTAATNADESLSALVRGILEEWQGGVGAELRTSGGDA